MAGMAGMAGVAGIAGMADMAGRWVWRVGGYLWVNCQPVKVSCSSCFLFLQS